MVAAHRARVILVLPCFLILPALLLSAPARGQTARPANLFANPGFEFGSSNWHCDTAGDTDARFVVESTDAYAGEHCASVTVGDVEQWGVQFGQSLDAGTVGKTYTFAALAKSVGKSVAASLQIERRAEPWDRAAKSQEFTLAEDAWTELHVTFTVDKPFPQGWFAYLSCTQANSRFRVDAFRLYQGEYVPYEEAQREEMAAIQVSLFDTGARSSAPLSRGSFANKARWTRLPEDETGREFSGDAVVTNDRLAAVFRPGRPGAEVYVLRAEGPVLRAVLAPVVEETEPALASVAVVENTPGLVAVDATFKSPRGKTAVLRYELEMGQAFVATEARGGTTGLRVRAPCRFVVLPDFFADDIVVDAAEIPADQAELPSENFLLSMLPDREAIVMSVSSSRDTDARITLSGQDGERVIDGSEIRYGEEGKIWVAVIEGRDIWHVREITDEDAGRSIPLDWTAPYAAQWRVDWRRTDKLTGSWEMIAQTTSGQFEKHGWFGSPTMIPEDRKRWTTVLGRFLYPCWVDQHGQGHLQPFASRMRFEGPALIYPINRVPQTPLTALCVVDVVRATLGVGPCEYILDVEGQGTAMKGRATCANRDTLDPIYAAGRQKEERATIEESLTEVLIFVEHIRSRIDAYVDFGHQTLAYLDAQKKAHPELSDFLAEMESLTRAIDERFDARKDKIQTSQYVAGLTEKFRATLLDYEGPDALEKCKEITGAIVVVGGNQDELVGECRMAVKVLRQRAGLAMAADPRAAEIATEIRRRTQQILRAPTSYEAPRH
ncbi:MAG: hypothetical protein A2V98_05670 [Planctomycetes bacterium RBG_16_64_12]|nr:MAG: hypothetical protein A2V98_05670 [Planctomycetes bacterium RBG_16_64_12]